MAAAGRAAFGQALDATRPGGRILSFAATSRGETAEVDLGALTTAEKDILTAYSSSIEVQELAAQLVFDREVRVRELVSHRLPLDAGRGGLRPRRASRARHAQGRPRDRAPRG